MSLVHFLKKATNVFTRSNKEKKKKDVIEGSAPQPNNLPSSSQQEEKSDGGNDDDKLESNTDNLKNLTKLFVGCLAHSTTSKELEDYFSQFGKVIKSVVLIDPKSKKSRGFGFVTFIDPESAKAVLEIKNHILDGRKINPQPFRSKSKERNYENRVFLGSLPFDFTEENVKQFFREFGEIEDVVIPLDRETMKSRGYGFLSFKDKLIAEKLIAQGFVYMNNRRVFINKAGPHDFHKINDSSSTHSSSDTNVEKGLEITESFADFNFLPESEDDVSSVVSGERHPIIKLNFEIQKFFEEYFSKKFSHLNTMNEKETKDESNKHNITDDNVGEIEKILADFFINSSEQFGAFEDDLIKFSDDSDFNGSDAGDDTSDEEKDVDTDNNDDDDDDDGNDNDNYDDGNDDNDSITENFGNTFQELSAKFTKMLEDKSKSCTKISESKSPTPQMSEFFSCQKSSVPLKIKDEKGLFVCSLCQWMPPESSCETFLAHCKTAAHRIKLKERFLTEQNEEDTPKTVYSQTSTRTQETCSKKSFSKNQNRNRKNRKCKAKEQKQLQTPQPQSQQQPQAKIISSKRKKSKKTEKNKSEEKHTPQNLESKAKKIKTLNLKALAKSMACIQLLSEQEIICKMCSKIIPKALDANTLMKNVSHHLQSKGHLNKLLEIEDSLKKALKKNLEEEKSDNTKKKNSCEKNAKEKNIVGKDSPKVETSKQKDKNAAPLLKKEEISNQKKVSKYKNSESESVGTNIQTKKTDKKKPCSNTPHFKTDYFCATCNSYFQNKKVFLAHMNSETNLNCPDSRNVKSVSASNNLNKCKSCKI